VRARTRRTGPVGGPLAGQYAGWDTDPLVAVVPDDLDNDPWLLNTRAGTINLRTGTHAGPRPW